MRDKLTDLMNAHDRASRAGQARTRGMRVRDQDVWANALKPGSAWARTFTRRQRLREAIARRDRVNVRRYTNDLERRLTIAMCRDASDVLCIVNEPVGGF